MKKGENYNRPGKGRQIKVEPIRDFEAIQAIKYLLKDGEFFFLPRTLTFDWSHNLRYHLTRSLDINPVAFADVLTPDVVFIV